MLKENTRGADWWKILFLYLIETQKSWRTLSQVFLFFFFLNIASYALAYIVGQTRSEFWFGLN